MSGYISLSSPEKSWSHSNPDNEDPHETWERLDFERAPFLDRQREAAALTYPQLCPPEGVDPDTADLGPDGTSIMANMVSNLASQVHDTLFPDTVSFVKTTVTKKGIQSMIDSGVIAGQDHASDMAQIKTAEAFAERNISEEWGRWGQSSKTQLAILHAVVVGQGALLLGEDGDLECLTPDSYVLERGKGDKIITFCIGRMERVIDIDPEELEAADVDEDGHVMVPVVTRYRVIRKDKKRKILRDKSINNVTLPERFNKEFNEDNVPYIVVPWQLSPGASYARGPVMSNFGDIEAFTLLAQASSIYSILMSSVKILISHGAGISPEDYAAMNNGDVRYGEAEGVNPVATGDYRVVQSLIQMMDTYRQRIGQAFIDTNAAIRDSERTTAYEIQQAISALNRVYTSVYESMAKALQIPIARMIMKRLGIHEDDGTLEISIVAGKGALSRMADAQRLSGYMSTMAQTNQLPPQALQAINWQALMREVASYYSVKIDDLVLTPEQIQQQLAQQAAAQEQAPQ